MKKEGFDIMWKMCVYVLCCRDIYWSLNANQLALPVFSPNTDSTVSKLLVKTANCCYL